MSTFSDFVKFLEEYSSYRADNFRVNYLFIGLSNDITLIIVA